MALASQAGKNRRTHQAFFRAMEENLKCNTTSIQDMKRGRLPLVPSLDPKDALNLSCTSMLALATGIRHKYLLQPVCIADTASSMLLLMPAIPFWVSLFCEHIILPSRTLEFKFVDFHKAVVHILAWVMDQNKLQPKVLTDYLPFLWFHPPAGYTKYSLDDAQAVFTAVDHTLLGCNSTSLRDALVSRLAENSTLTANLIVQFIVDVFAHVPESESDMKLPIYQCFSTVASSTLQLASQSLPIHTALLKNNSIQWMSRVLRFATRRARFTYVVLRVATDCASKCLLYILRVMEDGHSPICQLLGCDILRYLLLACRNLHAHPELMERELEVLQTSMENHTVKILEMIISHFSYPSILKRAQKAISKVQRRHIDDFLDRKYVGLKGVCDAWTKFVNIASYKSTVYGPLSDSFCGNAQVRRLPYRCQQSFSSIIVIVSWNDS